ncbi:MAG: type II toxin-antitoxin system VapC family toxin [Pseudomonadota bacterium]
MRAVDTNILTRYFRQDDSRQSPAALRVMAGRAVFCPKTVVLEFEWVMRHVYRHEPADIARCLTTLLKLPNVVVEDEQQVIDALRGYERGMDFADALHLSASHTCEDLVTFDARRFARRATRLVLKPPVTVPAV